MNFEPIITEIFLAISAMVLLIVGVFIDRKGSDFPFKTTVAIIAVAIWLLLHMSDAREIAMNGMFITDSFAIFMKVLILFAAAFVTVISLNYFRSIDKKRFEFPILILLSVVGMMIMVSANSLISLYMGLELQSLSLYVLTAIDGKSTKSSEAGLKYFMLGALSSGLLLYGCSLIYGFAGTVNFTELSEMYLDTSVASSTGIIVGMVFVIVGLCFKVSAVPFHMWAPDVYEGAPKCVTAFFATAPKVAAIAIFIRFVHQPFGLLAEQWQQIIVFISIASMLVGAFGAMRQNNIKRLLAYSSIGHVGYILIGVAVGTQDGISAAIVYTTLYIIMNIGVFACVVLMKSRDVHLEDINSLSGLAQYRQGYAFVLALLMFSMAGIPPIAGFFGKLYIFRAAIGAEFYTLAIIGVLSSVVGAYYYLRVIKVMYFDDVPDSSNATKIDVKITGSMKAILVGAAAFNLLFFLAPAPLLEAAKIASESLFL